MSSEFILHQRTIKSIKISDYAMKKMWKDFL